MTLIAPKLFASFCSDYLLQMACCETFRARFSNIVLSLVLLVTFVSLGDSYADELIAKTDRSSVRIFAKNETSYTLGSGVVISSDGYVVTNLHVVENATEIVVFTRGDGRNLFFGATLQRTMPIHDLALLRVSELRSEAATLATRLPSKGDPIFALGYPSAADAGNLDPEDTSFTESSLTRGNVSRVLEAKRADRGQPITVIQHSANLTRGNSGGGLFDVCGRLIGINTLVLVDDVGQSISESVSTTSLIEVFRRSDISYRLEDSGCANDSPSTTSTAPPQVSDTARESTKLQPLSPLEPRPKQRDDLREIVITGAVLVLASTVLLFIFVRNRNLRSRKYRKEGRIQQAGNSASSFRKGSTSDLQLVGTLSDGTPTSVRINMRRLESNGRLIIGREADADVTIPDGSVSRRHATLELHDRRMTLTDLGSTNGTWVDDTPVGSKQTRSVRRRDSVRFGKVSFVLQSRR